MCGMHYASRRCCMRARERAISNRMFSSRKFTLDASSLTPKETRNFKGGDILIMRNLSVKVDNKLSGRYLGNRYRKERWVKMMDRFLFEKCNISYINNFMFFELLNTMVTFLFV